MRFILRETGTPLARIAVSVKEGTILSVSEHYEDQGALCRGTQVLTFLVCVGVPPLFSLVASLRNSIVIGRALRSHRGGVQLVS